MARALVVDRQTTELRIALQRGCHPAAAETVTLTVTRIGLCCAEPPPPCDDPCRPRLRQAHEIGAGVWGGNCDPCGMPSGDAPDTTPRKVYQAVEIHTGVARFVLDDDLIQAPEGWYSGRIRLDREEAGHLIIRVRSGIVRAQPDGVSWCVQSDVGVLDY